MPSNRKSLAAADPKRFITIQDLTRMRPDCGASIDDFFVIGNELLLIVDMAQMGDILNPYNRPSAVYLRTHGVFVHSRIWTEPCPIYWGEPFLILPLSNHLNRLAEYEDVSTVVGSVLCSSGALLMMPIREDMPTPLGRLVDEAFPKKTGVRIKVPSGTYRVFYEQFETPEGADKELYRNIVVQQQ